MSTDDRINGLLFDDTRPVIKQNTTNKNNINKNNTIKNKVELIESREKGVGRAEVILDVDRDGFVDLFITLLSSLP